MVLSKSSLLIFAPLFMLYSCAPARYVQPLHKGQTAISANLGGPLIGYSNTTIPVPLSSLAIGYGMNEDLTGFAGIHTTSLAFGVIQADIGITKGILKPQSGMPGVSVTPVANLMFDKWQHQFSFFPQLDANAYWNYGKQKHCMYIGLSNWFDLHRNWAEGMQSNHWVPIVQAGNVFEHKRWAYTLELKYIAPNYKNTPLVVDYRGIGGTGAVGVYIGVTKKF